MQPADKPKDIPTDAGVYRFRDASKRVIYVGKAKNLKNRLSSYFGQNLHPRTYKMVTTATSVDWVVVRSETEALQLEYSWIKEFDPTFNVRFRDDKTYPYLAVTTKEEFPRAFVYRGDRKKGITYVGPFVHTWALNDTLDHMLRVFPMRSCTNGVFRNAKATKRPCLLADIGRCTAPCVDRIGAEDHRKIVNDFLTFIAGDSQVTIKDRERQMQEASDAQDYERASVLRDDLKALDRVRERGTVNLPMDTQADVIAIDHDDLQSAVQIFSVRHGRIIGQRGFVMENSVDFTPESLMTDAMMHAYEHATDQDIPVEILVNVLPESSHSIESLLSDIRQAKVSLRVPARGDKRALMETVLMNATQALKAHKAKRSTDLVSRSKALSEIQQALGLEDAPLRIECVDVSHIQGTNVVASLVVFEDGLAKKKDYRSFVIENPRDDTASIHEVVTRRFATPEAASGPYRPNLLVIDGGLPQVNAARRALVEVGASDIFVVGLAKRMEEIWHPNAHYPVILPRGSEALFLLQRIRDEAHRFAITHHRSRRSKSMTDSELDSVPGLGPAKKKALMAKFGSLKNIRAASLDELTTAVGIGPALAEQIYHTLHAEIEQGIAVNVTTGEIIEL
jgi:excinuclease ABC subunit C